MRNDGKPTAQRKLCAPRPATPRAEPPHLQFTTEDQIAADRRRPIGAVIADICRDLAILPSHPLWRELQQAIVSHGGSYIGLLKHVLKRNSRPNSPPRQIRRHYSRTRRHRPALSLRAYFLSLGQRIA